MFVDTSISTGQLRPTASAEAAGGLHGLRSTKVVKYGTLWLSYPVSSLCSMGRDVFGECVFNLSDLSVSLALYRVS